VHRLQHPVRKTTERVDRMPLTPRKPLNGVATATSPLQPDIDPSLDQRPAPDDDA